MKLPVGSDSYLFRFNLDGSPNWGVYYGTINNEIGRDVVTDYEGNSIFSGNQDNDGGVENLVGTSLGFQTTGLGEDDPFICKINEAGLLEWSSYYSGNENDRIEELAVQLTTGNVFIGGKTTSTSGIPLQDNGGFYRGTPNTSIGAVVDGFVAEISATGTLLWSTFYGNYSSNGYTIVKGISIDVTYPNRLVITGATNGNNSAIVTAPCTSYPSGFPVCDPGTNIYYLDNSLGGNRDAFIADFDLSNNNSLTWSTLFGGDGTENNIGPAKVATIFQENNIHDVITGTTSSATNFDLPVYFNSYNQTAVSGFNDAFIVRFVNRRILWSTLYGGASNEYPHDIGFDNERNLYLMGFGASGISSTTTDYCSPPTNNGFPLCENATNLYFNDTENGNGDNFLTCFDKYGNMQWSTFFGGQSWDTNRGMTIDRNNNHLFISGRTESNELSFPLTPWFPASHYLDVFTTDNQSFISLFDISNIPETVGIDEESSINTLDLTMYPNPVASNLSIRFSKTHANITIEIYDNIGKLVFSKYFDHIIKQKEIKLNLSNLESGIYYLNIPNMDNYERKIIKK